MTTTGTCGSPAAPAVLSLVLLAAILVLTAAPAVSAEEGGQTVSDAVGPVLVPEPATLLFVGLAGLALFRRRGKQHLH